MSSPPVYLADLEAYFAFLRTGGSGPGDGSIVRRYLARAYPMPPEDLDVVDITSVDRSKVVLANHPEIVGMKKPAGMTSEQFDELRRQQLERSAKPFLRAMAAVSKVPSFVATKGSKVRVLPTAQPSAMSQHRDRVVDGRYLLRGEHPTGQELVDYLDRATPDVPMKPARLRYVATKVQQALERTLDEEWMTKILDDQTLEEVRESLTKAERINLDLGVDLLRSRQGRLQPASHQLYEFAGAHPTGGELVDFVARLDVGATMSVRKRGVMRSAVRDLLVSTFGDQWQTTVIDPAAADRVIAAGSEGLAGPRARHRFESAMALVAQSRESQLPGGEVQEGSQLGPHRTGSVDSLDGDHGVAI